MNSPTNRCFFCPMTVRITQVPDAQHVQCPACTDYQLTGSAERILENYPLDGQEKAIFSGYLREHTDTVVTHELAQKIRDMRRLSPTEKSIKLLAYINSQTKNPGQAVVINANDRIVMASAWLVDKSELEWQIIQSLHFGLGYVTAEKNSNGKSFKVTITPAGFKAVPKQPLGFKP